MHPLDRELNSGTRAFNNTAFDFFCCHPGITFVIRIKSLPLNVFVKVCTKRNRHRQKQYISDTSKAGKRQQSVWFITTFRDHKIEKTRAQKIYLGFIKAQFSTQTKPVNLQYRSNAEKKKMTKCPVYYTVLRSQSQNGVQRLNKVCLEGLLYPFNTLILRYG